MTDVLASEAPAPEVAPGVDGLALVGGSERPPESRLGRTGFFTTAIGARQEKYLAEQGDQLRAYLLARLRDVQRATDAYEDVTSWLARQKRSTLEEAPSIQAAYFAAARRFFRAQLESGHAAGAIDDVPWEAIPPGSPEGYGAVLDVVRHGLGEEELELLELRYARRLKVDELSFVLDRPVEELMIRLESAMGYARLLVAEVRHAKPPTLAHVLHDAFQVVPHSLREAFKDRRRVPPKLAPETRIGERFEIVECVGGGAFAWVYRARDVRVPGHQVALKVLHRPARTEPAREGAIRELSVIASAFHPSLVQLKEHGWHQDRLWFVMPWYQGETLGERIAREPLAVAEAIPIFASLGRAMSALHAAGVVHRDVKPDNVFLARLDTEGSSTEVLPVVLDLGVAAPEGDLALAGTPVYFAPEMARRIVDEDADVGVSSKADVFALALTFVHAVTGAPDVAGVSLEAFVAMRAKSAPELPKIGGLGALENVLRRALSVEAVDRPTAGELAEAFESVGVRRVRRGPSAATGNRLAWVLAVVGLGAAAYFGWGWRAQHAAALLENAQETTLRRELDRQRLRAATLETRLREAMREDASEPTAEPEVEETAQSSITSSNRRVAPRGTSIR